MVTKAELEKALLRAVDSHGHEYNCSSVQGMERDCHCGWLEVKELVAKVRPALSTRKSK